MPVRLAIRDLTALNTEVKTIAGLMTPDLDLGFHDRLFRDVVRLFIGDFEGYQASNTAYHDLHHTLATLLATARVMHGVHLARAPISARLVQLSLCAALLHDVGYIMREDDHGGTGAKYTFTHVRRSIEFMHEYFDRHDRPRQDARDVELLILGTDLGTDFGTIAFADEQQRTVARCLATADLLAQMADELYGEKLVDLYQEFSEAGMPGYETDYDLVRSTRDFAQAMQHRMRSDLDDVGACVAEHFKARSGVDENLYAQAMERNIDYLASIVERHGPQYHTRLKRKPDRRPPFL